MHQALCSSLHALVGAGTACKARQRGSGAALAPARQIAVGIDLGTTNSVIAVRMISISWDQVTA